MSASTIKSVPRDHGKLADFILFSQREFLLNLFDVDFADRARNRFCVRRHEAVLLEPSEKFLGLSVVLLREFVDAGAHSVRLRGSLAGVLVLVRNAGNDIRGFVGRKAGPDQIVGGDALEGRR